jgi:predicted nucleic acid-binding Zn ribbon protein
MLGQASQLFNSVGIVFKGSGFYRTDSRGTSGAASEPAKTDSAPAAKSESSSTASPSSSSTATAAPAKAAAS